MFTDNAIVLATTEAVPNGAATPGGLGGNSITGVAATPFTIDMAQSSNPIGIGLDDIGNSELELNVTITTSFTTTSPVATLEWQLVSMPINPTLLTSATTSGKLLSLAGVVTDSTADTFAIASHGLALGTPFYLSAVATTTNISTNTLYFAIPTGSGTFKAATSFANAIAGTGVDLQTGNGTATVVFLPAIHLTTGPVPTVFLKAGARVSGRSFRQLPVVGGKLVAPYSGATPMPLGAAVQPTATTTGAGAGGAGGTAVVRTPGRYLALNVVAAGANSDTTGRYSVQLGLQVQNSQVHFPMGMQAL